LIKQKSRKVRLSLLRQL